MSPHTHTRLEKIGMTLYFLWSLQEVVVGLESFQRQHVEAFVGQDQEHLVLFHDIDLRH